MCKNGKLVNSSIVRGDRSNVRGRRDIKVTSYLEEVKCARGRKGGRGSSDAGVQDGSGNASADIANSGVKR